MIKIQDNCLNSNIANGGMPLIINTSEADWYQVLIQVAGALEATETRQKKTAATLASEIDFLAQAQKTYRICKVVLGNGPLKSEEQHNDSMKTLLTLIFNELERANASSMPKQGQSYDLAA